MRVWKDLENKRLAREMKIRFFLTKKLMAADSKVRAFDLWKQYSILSKEFYQNNMNWAASVQYTQGLDILDKLAMRNKIFRFNQFKKNVFPSVSRRSQIVSMLVERFNQKRQHAFSKLKENNTNSSIEILKLSKVVDSADQKAKDWLRDYFYKLKKNNTVEKINLFARVANFRGGQKAFTNMKLFMAQERAIDVAEALKLERMINLLERLKNKSLNIGLRALASGPSAEEEVTQAVNVFEKTLLRLRGDNPLKRAFGIWRTEANGFKKVDITANF